MLIVVALIGLVSFVGQNHFGRATATKGKSNSTQNEPSPYLQIKTELDTEEKERYELEAKNGEYESRSGERDGIEGDGCRVEMTGANTESRVFPSLMERHELGGAEFPIEMDAHGTES